MAKRSKGGLQIVGAAAIGLIYVVVIYWYVVIPVAVVIGLAWIAAKSTSGKNSLPVPSPQTIPPAHYLNKRQLEERGWTDAGIEQFLGQPDDVVNHPGHRSGRRRYRSHSYSEHRYNLCRIEAVEQSSEWQQWQKESEKRRARAAEFQRQQAETRQQAEENARRAAERERARRIALDITMENK